MAQTLNEKTPLLGESSESSSTPFKLYTKRNRSFQTCLCASIGVLIFVIFVGVVWYIFELKSVKSNADPFNVQDLNRLRQNEWPRRDVQLQVVLPYQSLFALINEAVDEGKQRLEIRKLKDESVPPLDPESPTFKHHHSIVYSTTGNNISDYGYIESMATKYLWNKGVRDIIYYGSATDLKWADETDCNNLNDSISCERGRYRSVDGSCNNLKHPRTWGVGMTPFRRALPPEYEDGVSVPRGGFHTTLPTARDISTKIHRPVYQKDENFSVMLAVWGQFLDHDITATALSRGVNGTPITCCNSKIQHPECFPVLLDSNDSYYGEFDLTCMEFVRSAPALSCFFGPREQLNQVSSYIDGSMIYGNTKDLTERLRTFNNGELDMSFSKDGRALLPITTDPTDGCNQQEEIKKGRYCFLSGDSRANENTHLTSIHLILARHHNYIASQLRALNPFWNDETLYQESRRIVAAQIQHITYNEFLPAILGVQMMEILKLHSENTGYWTKYNDSVEATISNNFATAAFRFAHTLIPRMMKLLANDTSSPEYIEMHKMLFNPFGLYDGELDSIIRGAFNTSAEKADNYFTEQLTEHLFESTRSKESAPKLSYGLDLVSLNIQRGRDHGLPGYTKWREYCGFATVRTYDDLRGVFDEESLEAVLSLYKSVHDIDLYTGGLSEIPSVGGLLGPTFTCLIADQFYRLKYGDRFWYETDENPQAFTPEQLNEIRKTSLAGIICQNADDLEKVTPAVMRASKENNEPISCSRIPQPNISVWQTSSDKGILLNVIYIEIKFPKHFFRWNNQSKAQIPPQALTNGRLTSFVSWKVNGDSKNEIRLGGNFVYFAQNGSKIDGLFVLKAETFGHFDVTNMRIMFPIYLTSNDTDNSNASNVSRIIFHSVPISSGQLVWEGRITVALMPLSWNNSSYIGFSDANSAKKSKSPMEEDSEYAKSPKSKTTLPQDGVNYESNEKDDFNTETNGPKNFSFEEDFPNLQKKVQAGAQNFKLSNDNIIVAESQGSNSSREDNILYKILEIQGEKRREETTLEEDELAYLQDLSPNSSIYLDNSPKIRDVIEQISPVNISVGSVEISDHPILEPPVEMPVINLENKTIAWNFNSKYPLNGTFEISGTNGTFKINFENVTTSDLHLLNPSCKYYSKITFNDPSNRSDLFDVDSPSGIDDCTVIAPLQLHGHLISPQTFTWDGNATLRIRLPRNDLPKENELSLHLKSKQVLNFPLVTGTVLLLNETLWNGSLPIRFSVDNLGWAPSERAIAYPVLWSGVYEDENFIGNFIVLEKVGSSIERREGKFSINLPSISGIQDLIKSFSMYESIFYLTEDLSFIHGSNVSQFDIVEDLDLRSSSRILLIGEFVPDGFIWFGNVTMILPEDDSSSNTGLLTYRPHGKYIAEIYEATLFAILRDEQPILKWWSGILPSKVIIPASETHLQTFRNIFNNAIIWSYEVLNGSAHATFKTYGNESKIHLFGDFEFQATSLYENIKTSALRPYVDYFSPLVLQHEKKNYNDDIDLITELNNLSRPNTGIFAPIMLLGNYTSSGDFEWNLKCIIFVVDN